MSSTIAYALGSLSAGPIGGGLGGTDNLAVLGGNLPPSRTHDGHSPSGARVERNAVGRVARQNGQVGRSTQTK